MSIVMVLEGSRRRGNGPSQRRRGGGIPGRTCLSHPETGRGSTELGGQHPLPWGSVAAMLCTLLHGGTKEESDMNHVHPDPYLSSLAFAVGSSNGLDVLCSLMVHVSEACSSGCGAGNGRNLEEEEHRRSMGHGASSQKELTVFLGPLSSQGSKSLQNNDYVWPPLGRSSM